MVTGVVDRLCAAMYKLLQKKKFNSISIKELIIDAKVNRSSYNYHFSDPEDIIDLMIDNFKKGFERNLIDNYPTDASYPHRYTMFNTLAYLKKNEAFIRVMDKSGFGEKVNMAIRNALVDYINSIEVMCLDENGNLYELSDDRLKDLRTRLHVHYMIGYINFWISRDFSISSDEMAALLDKVEKCNDDIKRYYRLLESRGQV